MEGYSIFLKFNRNGSEKSLQNRLAESCDYQKVSINIFKLI